MPIYKKTSTLDGKEGLMSLIEGENRITWFDPDGDTRVARKYREWLATGNKPAESDSPPEPKAHPLLSELNAATDIAGVKAVVRKLLGAS